MSLMVLLTAWVLILVALATVTAVRWSMGRREDDHLHFSPGEQPVIAAQAEIAHKLDLLDRWKTSLTILTVAFGLLILAVHAYRVWQVAGSVGMN